MRYIIKRGCQPVLNGLNLTAVLIASAISTAIYMCVAYLLKVPTIKQSATIQKASFRPYKKVNHVHVIIQGIVSLIYRYIPVTPVQELKLTSAIVSAGLDVSVQQYLAKPFAYIILLTPLIIATYLVSPVLSVVFLVIAGVIFFKEYNYVFDLQKSLKQEIESELLNFTILISHELKYDRNIIGLIDNYKNTANGVLQRELSITLADMRTSNYDEALKRLEARVGSLFMSKVVNGLILANSGSDTIFFFDNIISELKSLEKARMNDIINKKKPKIARMTFLVMMAFFLFIMTILGKVMFDSFEVIFR